MKKLVGILISLLIIVVGFGNVFTVRTSALSPEEVIAFKKAYTKEGRFVMPVAIGAFGTASATLTDSNGTVIETFKTMMVESGTTITYKRSFSGVKSGVYYLNVNFKYALYSGLGEKTISRTMTITHNAPAPKVAFSKTYQIYNDSGDLLQVFKLDYSNAKGKKINFEVYDAYGTQFYNTSFVANYVNGNCTRSWNYYPSKGGLRASNGTYVLKYWVEGQTPKQINFEVALAEG